MKILELLLSLSWMSWFEDFYCSSEKDHQHLPQREVSYWNLSTIDWQFVLITWNVIGFDSYMCGRCLCLFWLSSLLTWIPILTTLTLFSYWLINLDNFYMSVDWWFTSLRYLKILWLSLYFLCPIFGRLLSQIHIHSCSHALS